MTETASSCCAGRECISPEVNRNKNIGEKGANMQRLVYRKYLSKMNWSQQPVSDWGDLSGLLQPQYDRELSKLVGKAEPWEGPLNIRTMAAAGTKKVYSEAEILAPKMRQKNQTISGRV